MKKISLCLLACSAAIALTGCRSADYEQANEMMIGGRFQEALPIYEGLENYKNADQYAEKCRYELGLKEMEAENWDQAIAYFRLVDSEEGKKQAELCETEKKMEGMADRDFLEDIEKSVKARNALREGIDPFSKFVSTELAYLDEYQDARFNDQNLGRLCRRYLTGLETQKKALQEKYADAQIQWQQGVVDRFHVLKKLHEEYGAFDDDPEFKRDYLLGLPEEEDRLARLRNIESDLFEFFYNLENVQYYGPGTYYVDYSCGAIYGFNLQLYIDFKDKDGNLITSTFAEFDNIIPGQTRQLIFTTPMQWDTCCFNWEMIPR